MAKPGVTYAADPPIEGRKFVCKRCKRQYPYPAPGERPIRCECGWWYFNDGNGIREAYCQRIEPYRTPRDVLRLFARPVI
ncbi:MAG: hypothetical protein JOZ01_03645 [Candidatus Eremiobacteraeota bacterium]|nr:hypothetical protein [Candidatus Eremiobacteraeota bacterium]